MFFVASNEQIYTLRLPRLNTLRSLITFVLDLFGLGEVRRNADGRNNAIQV